MDSFAQSEFLSRPLAGREIAPLVERAIALDDSSDGQVFVGHELFERYLAKRVCSTRGDTIDSLQHQEQASEH